MSDIVDELLRERAPLYFTDSIMRTTQVHFPSDTEKRAADEITRLRSLLKEAVEALKYVVTDCEGYAAWQRPVDAVEKAKAFLAKHKGT